MAFKIYKLKKGKAEEWKKHCDFLMQHKEEALETIIEEGGTIEGCKRFGDFVIMWGDTTGKANLDREINKKHQAALKNCLEDIDEEILYLFKK